MIIIIYYKLDNLTRRCVKFLSLAWISCSVSRKCRRSIFLAPDRSISFDIGDTENRHLSPSSDVFEKRLSPYTAIFNGDNGFANDRSTITPIPFPRGEYRATILCSSLILPPPSPSNSTTSISTFLSTRFSPIFRADLDLESIFSS